MSNLDPISAELATLAADYENKNKAILAELRKLRYALEYVAVSLGVDDSSMEDMTGPTVSEIVNTVSDGCRRDDLGGKVDMLRATKMCVFAAWRFADAAYRGVSRETDPTTQEGPDDPVGV